MPTPELPYLEDVPSLPSYPNCEPDFGDFNDPVSDSPVIAQEFNLGFPGYMLVKKEIL
jgi:hypothetical protein